MKNWLGLFLVMVVILATGCATKPEAKMLGAVQYEDGTKVEAHLRVIRTRTGEDVTTLDQRITEPSKVPAVLSVEAGDEQGAKNALVLAELEASTDSKVTTTHDSAEGPGYWKAVTPGIAQGVGVAAAGALVGLGTSKASGPSAKATGGDGGSANADASVVK